MVRQIQHSRLRGRSLITDFQPVSAGERIGHVEGELSGEPVLTVSRDILQCHGTVRLAFQRPYMVSKTGISSMRDHSLTIILQRVLYSIQRELGTLDAAHITTHRSTIVLSEATVVHHIVKARHAVLSIIYQTD